MKIPITRPVFGPEERAAVVKPLESGWVVQGPFVAEFERKFADFSGAPHAVATSSCTTAMHIAVAALGLKPGDEVIVPAFTWVSTPNVIESHGRDAGVLRCRSGDVQHRRGARRRAGYAEDCRNLSGAPVRAVRRHGADSRTGAQARVVGD
jgi:hypothetical protein